MFAHSKTITGNEKMGLISRLSMNKPLKTSLTMKLTRNNSFFNTFTKPFPTTNPEFYEDNHNYFWHNEIKRNNSHKQIFQAEKTLTKSKSAESNRLIFYNSNVFKRNSCNNTVKGNGNHNYNNKEPKRVEIDLTNYQRERDFNSNVCVTDPSKSKKFEEEKKFVKTITPMHLKYYESTIQKEKDSNITNPKPPTTHPVYDKNVIKKEVLTPTLKKKADNLKTSYNFLKNYY